MTTFDLAAATSESFASHLGETFEVVFSDGRLALILVESAKSGQARPGANREPFILTFRGEPQWRFPQQIYRLEHPSLGAMDIFLVQVTGEAGTSRFEAIFS